MDKDQLWKTVLGEIELSISKASFSTWFKDTYIAVKDPNRIVISCPNGFIKEWIQNKYNKPILKSIRVLDPRIKEIEYVTGTIKQEEKSRQEELMPPVSDPYIDRLTNLNKKYLFESFIVGSNSELAHAASIAITEKPGHVYNPLFIYGGVGLGKTHLIQAIGNKLLQEKSELSLLYIPSEKMVAELIEGIKNKTIESVKNKYAKVDVLLIDDIQFIAGKEKTQEILFSAFNALYNRNQQIVLTADRPPRAIPALEERLRSRFEGGMMADIGLPDFETRLAILKAKSKEKGCELEAGIADYIATNVQKNIRELEGALNKVIAVSQLSNKKLVLKDVEKILKTYLIQGFRRANAPLVLKAVSDFYNVSLEDLNKRSRKKEVVRPRQVAMFLLREETKLSFPEIGSKLGNRDHSTVMHAYEKIKREEQEEEFTKQELVMIKERIYSEFQ